MPIGSVHKSSQNISVALDYDLAQGRFAHQHQEKAPEIVITYNIHTREPKHIKAILKEQANENERVKNKALRFSINFDKSDNTPEYKRVEFVNKVMQEMGVKKDNHLAVVTKHNDKHPHYHVLVNRIGFDGKTLSDSNSIRRLELALDKWEKKMGIDNTLSKSRAYVYDESQEKGYKLQKRESQRASALPTQKMPKKEYVQQEVSKALKAGATTPEELKQALQEQKIEFKYTENFKGLAGTSFKYKNQAFKGTSIGYKANTLTKEFNKNIELKQAQARQQAQAKQQEQVKPQGNRWASAFNQAQEKVQLTHKQREFLERERERQRIEQARQQELARQQAQARLQELARQQEQAKQQAVEQARLQELEKFKEVEKWAYNEVRKGVEKEGIIFVHDVDEIIRKGMREVAPKDNVWATAERLGGEDWQYKLHKFAEQENQKKAMEKAQARLQEQVKPQVNERQQAFLRQEQEKAKQQEQARQQEQEEPRKYRGFRR